MESINLFSESQLTCRSWLASVTSTKSSSDRSRSKTDEIFVGWLFHFKQNCLWSSIAPQKWSLKQK